MSLGTYAGTKYIFKIHLNNSNKPLNHIDLKGEGWSIIDAQDQVLLLPFFMFQVIDVDEQVTPNHVHFEDSIIAEKIIQITLIELPFQNQLQPREVAHTSLIHYDQSLTP